MLTPRVQAALEAAFGPEFAHADPVLRPSKFADVQVNAPLALAKRLGLNPREVAARLVDHLDVAGVCDAVEVSGPGFVNLTAATDWIAAEIGELARDPHTGIVPEAPQTVVVDYSAPNVAKEMHVGHLRTTVVGDALVRTLEALGHNVIRQNHIGDWGTPFGMLIEHLIDVGDGSDEARLLTSDPNAFYQQARVKFDGDPEFADRSRARVVALQGGDEATLAIWDELVSASQVYFNLIYTTLGVPLTDADLAGAGGLRRARGGRAGPGQRRCAVCLPGGLHRPRRRSDASDHPQVRRRLRLRHHRSGHRSVPGAPAARRPDALRHRGHPVAAPGDGLRDGAGRGLATADHHRRAHRHRLGDRHRRQTAAHPRR
jgi:arginyl-tRNA synthetase